MGRALLQEISAPMDAIANQAPEMAAFAVRAQEMRPLLVAYRSIRATGKTQRQSGHRMMRSTICHRPSRVDANALAEVGFNRSK